MRLLVYGFGPYKQFRENITAKIIERLPKKSGLTKVIFPVRFHRSQFVRALKRHRPEIVLGLGQSSRRRIEIETRATNRRRANRRDPPKPILKNGPRWLPTTLEVNAGRRVNRSKNAGDYVCNYSIYVMLDQIKRSRLAVPFGFIHIPYDYDLRKARRAFHRVVKQISTAHLRTKSIKGDHCCPN